jgi:hypothetical protein
VIGEYMDVQTRNDFEVTLQYQPVIEISHTPRRPPTPNFADIGRSGL